MKLLLLLSLVFVMSSCATQKHSTTVAKTKVEKDEKKKKDVKRVPTSHSFSAGAERR